MKVIFIVLISIFCCACSLNQALSDASQEKTSEDEELNDHKSDFKLTNPLNKLKRKTTERKVSQVATDGESNQECMFNQEKKVYQECFHATVSGECTQFGSSCMPKDHLCVYNQSKEAYLECHQFTASGNCAHFGDSCIPRK